MKIKRGDYMGWNYRKRVRLNSGSTLNIGKKSIGVSGGVKGARIGLNSSGRMHFSLSIPGTGIRFTKYSKKNGGIISIFCSALVWMLIQMFKLTLIFTYWIILGLFMLFKWTFIGICRLFTCIFSGIRKSFQKHNDEMRE